MYKNDIKEILITEAQIQKRVKEIAGQIEKDFWGEKVLFVCALRGAALFFADLVRNISLNLNFDFIIASSYGSNSVSSGEVKIVKDLETNIEGQNVIIVEDIIDSGNTMFNLLNLLRVRNPKSLKVCAFLDKPSRRQIAIEGDYIGYKVPDEFVVGYGLDFNEDYRSLPFIGVLKEEIYKK